MDSIVRDVNKRKEIMVTRDEGGLLFFGFSIFFVLHCIALPCIASSYSFLLFNHLICV